MCKKHGDICGGGRTRKSLYHLNKRQVRQTATFLRAEGKRLDAIFARNLREFAIVPATFGEDLVDCE